MYILIIQRIGVFTRHLIALVLLASKLVNERCCEDQEIVKEKGDARPFRIIVMAEDIILK